MPTLNQLPAAVTFGSLPLEIAPCLMFVLLNGTVRGTDGILHLF